MDDPLLLTRDDYIAFARRTFPEPRLTVGWYQTTVNDCGQRLVADLVHALGREYEQISGTSYGRPEGRRYSWSGQYYSAGTNAIKVPPILVLPDTALREMERLWGPIAEMKWFREMVLHGGTCSRIDVTMDLYGYEIEPYVAAYKARDYLPYRFAQMVESRQQAGGGITIYFGSKTAGSSFTRMYEKGAQLGEPYPILRVEPQMRHDMAAQFSRHIYTAHSSVTAGLASAFPSRLDFRTGYGLSRETSNGHASRDCDASMRYPEWQAVLDMLPAAVPFADLRIASPPLRTDSSGSKPAARSHLQSSLQALGLISLGVLLSGCGTLRGHNLPSKKKCKSGNGAKR